MSDADEAPDAVLIERVRQGDEDAFRVLFERKVSVDDVLQESRIVAFRLLPKFEEQGPDAVRRWLRTIARLEVRSAVGRHAGTAKRAVGREVTRAGRRTAADYAGDEPTPSQVAIAGELEEMIERALDALPPDHRTVLRLVLKHRCSLREAAERMGRSREATKKLHARALARFTTELRKLRGESHG